MANTQNLKEKVEPFVRRWLRERFKISFESKEIVLSRAMKRNGKHEFDAVSEDGKIIAGIISSGGKTSRQKNPSGKIKKAIAEIYFLSLVEVDKRLLVLTDPDFFKIMRKEMAGKLAEGIEIVCCSLPAKLQEEVNRMRKTASEEVGG